MAGMTFGGLFAGGADTPFNISGPQFDMDPTKIKMIIASIAGTGESHPATTYTTVYTVPAGKTLYISSITMAEITGNNSVAYIKLNGMLVWNLPITTQNSQKIEFNSPVKLTAGQLVEHSNLTALAAMDVIIIGWEL